MLWSEGQVGKNITLVFQTSRHDQTVIFHTLVLKVKNLSSFSSSSSSVNHTLQFLLVSLLLLFLCCKHYQLKNTLLNYPSSSGRT